MRLINIPNSLANETFVCSIDTYHGGEPMLRITNGNAMCGHFSLPVVSTESEKRSICSEVQEILNQTLLVGVAQGQQKARIGLGLLN